MNPTLFEIGVAIVMVAASVALVVWFSRDVAAGSGRRLVHMLTRVGVRPEFAGQSDTEAIMRDVQKRCRRCASEGLCERWLAGKVEGDHSFCPNAQVFRLLTRTPERIAS